MRYRFALVLIIGLGLFAGCQGQTIRYDTIRYARDYYEKRVTLFRSQPIQKGGVIILGNSIAEYGDWQKLLNDSSIINRGIAADNTFGVLERLEDVISRRPNKLLIEIGINDISQDIPVAIIVDNIFAIVAQVKDKLPETRIYVHSILKTNDNVKNEYPAAFNKNRQSILVNQQLRRNAKRKNVYVYRFIPGAERQEWKPGCKICRI